MSKLHDIPQFTELANSDERLRLAVELNAVEAGDNEELLFEGAI